MSNRELISMEKEEALKLLHNENLEECRIRKTPLKQMCKNLFHRENCAFENFDSWEDAPEYTLGRITRVVKEVKQTVIGVYFYFDNGCVGLRYLQSSKDKFKFYLGIWEETSEPSTIKKFTYTILNEIPKEGIETPIAELLCAVVSVLGHKTSCRIEKLKDRHDYLCKSMHKFLSSRVKK